jgi:hypothetical protein
MAWSVGVLVSGQFTYDSNRYGNHHIQLITREQNPRFYWGCVIVSEALSLALISIGIFLACRIERLTD